MKISHVIIALLINLLIVLLILQAIKRQEAIIAACRLELSLCRESEKGCSTAISKQNEAIKRVRVDTIWREIEVRKVVTKYSVVRDTIILKLGKDSSCENQINIIDGLLHGFSGGVHPQNSDKN